MSLSISIKTPEGIVLATDSRLTVAQPKPGGMPDLCFMDSATKLWILGPPNVSVAVSFYGTAQTGVRSVGSLLKEWGQSQGTRKPVEQIARELHAWLGPKGLQNASLCVAGFDDTGYFGRMFELKLPGGVTELNAVGTNGIILGGQKDLAVKVLDAVKPPLDMMPLKATASLAKWLIDLTTASQSFSLNGLATVGGEAQIALLESGKGARLV